jgi:AcrR family transcriptional regulator
MREYVKVARAEAEERTRTALLDAATRVFLDEGWESTSLQDVAAEAGVTKQTLLRHFGSKEGLAETAFERAMAQATALRSQAPVGDVEGAVDNLLDHYEALGDRAIRLEAMHGGATVAEFVQRGREFHYAWVDHAFGPYLRGHHRQRRRAALIALCDVHTWRLLSRHLGLSRADVRATLLLAIRGVMA